MSLSSTDQPSALRRFFLPQLNRGFVIRLIVVALVAFVVFRYVARPMWVRGESMEPTYRDGQFLFSFELRYAFDHPDVGDVVTVRLAGPDVRYLKRVVATAGDTVAIHAGYLYVNGKRKDEPYVTYRNKHWELPPRQVKAKHVYVIGDNRGVAMERHRFGQAALERVSGAPLW